MTTAAADLAALRDDPRTKPRGRHRNKALAAWRRNQAVRLASKGVTYEAIANALGYSNRGTVYRLVHDALAVEASGNVDELRQSELEELYRLRRALAPQIAKGHVPSIMAAMGTSDRVWRLLRLVPDPRNRRATDRWDNCAGAPTVVARINDCRHAGCAIHGSFSINEPHDDRDTLTPAEIACQQ